MNNEPNNDQKEQLIHLTERVKTFFPELKEYKIDLGYADLPKTTLAQIQYRSKGGKLDYAESLRKAKPIYKSFCLDSIAIKFSKEILNLKHGLRKDAIMYYASHELTHFLECPKRLHAAQNLEIDFDNHSEEFYKTQIERFNRFRATRQQPPIENRKQFEMLISMALREHTLKGQFVEVNENAV